MCVCVCVCACVCVCVCVPTWGAVPTSGYSYEKTALYFPWLVSLAGEMPIGYRIPDFPVSSWGFYRFASLSG